jgi:hypothetical protein
MKLKSLVLFVTTLTTLSFTSVAHADHGQNYRSNGSYPIENGRFGGYYGTPPFNPNYESNYHLNYRNTSQRQTGCPKVHDIRDYQEWESGNYALSRQSINVVYQIQDSVAPGVCKVVRITGNGDDTHLAIDSHSIRWATTQEIGSKYKSQY